MDPVPETERMEFSTSPVPIVRLFAASQDNTYNSQEELKTPLKPPCIRRSTEPAMPSPHTPGWASPLPHRPRNTSPLARGHVRSRSTASALAPPIIRAQSMPGLITTGHLMITSQMRSASPKGSPHRNRALRKPVDEIFPVSPRSPSRTHASQGDLTNAILETKEEEEEETPSAPERSQSPSGGLTLGSSFRRTRRTSSPLRSLSLQSNSSGGVIPTTPTSLNSSPTFQSSKFSESFSNSYYSIPYATSSVPSTPTSLRSRSPSISSLETIPDTPDAEEAALEAERIAELKRAADAADGEYSGSDSKRSNSLDVAGGRGRTLGLTYGSRDKRKRWSVCGAERRGDLDLETIYEV